MVFFSFFKVFWRGEGGEERVERRRWRGGGWRGEGREERVERRAVERRGWRGEAGVGGNCLEVVPLGCSFRMIFPGNSQRVL